MKVYFLQHSRLVEPEVRSSMSIGIYSSMSVIDITIEKYKSITGFKDFPNDFAIEEYEVISQDNKEILAGQPLYFLQHEYSVDENGFIYDYCTDINIFSNYEDAKKEKEELIKDEVYPKSLESLYAPDGFCISEYILDEDNWIEGFVSY